MHLYGVDCLLVVGSGPIIAKHAEFEVEATGLHINPKYPYLGTSPDGLVMCAYTFRYKGRWALLNDHIVTSYAGHL